MKIRPIPTLLAAALSLSLASIAQAELPDRAADKATEQAAPGLEQGLDRDRATYRAETLEKKRLEKEESSKGAGLDRERARERAQRLEERRQQY